MQGKYLNGLGRSIRIGRFLVQNPLAARPGLGVYLVRRLRVTHASKKLMAHVGGVRPSPRLSLKVGCWTSKLQIRMKSVTSISRRLTYDFLAEML